MLEQNHRPISAHIGVLLPLLAVLALLPPLFLTGCAVLTESGGGKKADSNATQAAPSKRLPGFDASSATEPVIDPDVAYGLSAQDCVLSKDHPGAKLQDLQDLLHKSAQNKLLLDALHDKYLAKHLFSKGWDIPEKLRSTVLRCIRIEDEKFTNGKNIGDLCIDVKGGLVETGCDDLRVWQAERVPCLSQKGLSKEQLKDKALRDSLAAMLTRHEPSLKDADTKTLTAMLSQFSILKEAYDAPSSTYCCRYKAVYTPMAVQVFAGIQRAQKDKPVPPPPPKVQTRHYGLGLEHYPLGQALLMYGDDVAVIKGKPDALGRNTHVLGLNGLLEGDASIRDLRLQDVKDPVKKDNKGQKETNLVSIKSLHLQDFTIRLRFFHRMPMPRKGESVDLPLFILRFQDYVRDPVHATLQLDKKGDLQIQYHYRLVSSNFIPLQWPNRIHAYTVERGNHTVKFYADNELVLTAPSPGKEFQYIQTHLSYPDLLYEIDLQAEMPVEPDSQPTHVEPAKTGPPPKGGNATAPVIMPPSAAGNATAQASTQPPAQPQPAQPSGQSQAQGQPQTQDNAAVPKVGKGGPQPPPKQGGANAN